MEKTVLNDIKNSKEGVSVYLITEKQEDINFSSEYIKTVEFIVQDGVGRHEMRKIKRNIKSL